MDFIDLDIAFDKVILKNTEKIFTLPHYDCKTKSFGNADNKNIRFHTYELDFLGVFNGMHYFIIAEPRDDYGHMSIYIFNDIFKIVECDVIFGGIKSFDEINGILTTTCEKIIQIT